MTSENALKTAEIYTNSSVLSGTENAHSRHAQSCVFTRTDTNK